MAAAAGEISVEVVGGEIVVTKLGTIFLLAYRKSAEEPRLVLRRSRIPPTTDSLQECVSYPSVAGSKRQGARAWLDCLVQLASVGVETSPSRLFV